MNISSSGSCLPLTILGSGQISGLCIDFFFNLELKVLNWKVIIIILKTFWRLSHLVYYICKKAFCLLFGTALVVFVFWSYFQHFNVNNRVSCWFPDFVWQCTMER